jgi:hypothetical protein
MLQVRSSRPPSQNWFCEKVGSDENVVLVNVYGVSLPKDNRDFRYTLKSLHV